MPLTRRNLLIGAAATPAAILLARTARADVAPVYTEKGIAIDGTDPVAYFKENAPVAGSESITHKWNGATWRFSSEDNKVAFAADPEAYAPQYGGYCAWAVSEGYTASTIPEAWKIVDGKLYLNFSRRIQRRWERDIPNRIALGDANWPKIIA
ncbi:MAG: YHS domain-containing (seleno)protein [Roseobacter sp.]|jgi:YHS domain-containing protein|nr:YHS domain-containing (seleno)protein [Roseobacter sp.]